MFLGILSPVFPELYTLIPILKIKNHFKLSSKQIAFAQKDLPKQAIHAKTTK